MEWLILQQVRHWLRWARWQLELAQLRRGLRQARRLLEGGHEPAEKR